jgi:putative AlgH/UPF0301 family transcriptional regulator
MQLQPCTLLRATTLLNATHFEDAVILIKVYNEKGAVGFVINKPIASS